MKHTILLAGALAVLLFGRSAPAYAHPVPKKTHDRTILVRLTAEAIVVEYRLEVDEWTAVNDLVAVLGKDELAALKKPREFYAAFTRAYGPILAAHLHATLDGKELTFKCIKDGHEVLDHLRCDFVFQADLKQVLGQDRTLKFREGNYELDGGRIDLSISADGSVTLYKSDQPDEVLKKRPPTERKPGDEARLRQVSALWEVKAERVRVPPREITPPELLPSPREIAQESLPLPREIPAIKAGIAPVASADGPEAKPRTLLDLVLSSQLGLWTLLLLSAAFGAVHALTPGHGKTLVAAYLVGERGTVWHALLLGVVTTLTHTGTVLLVAAALVLMFPDAVPAHVQTALGFIGGLLIAGLGFWLVLRRLSGGPDHIHIGGGHSHHHHGDHDHVHAHAAIEQPFGRWGLIVLGISGGIVPCWDAIAMLGFAIAAQRLWLGLPLLLAFSAGLAGVLVLIGIAVVHAKGFAGSHWGESRVFRALPLASAVVITGMGLWLCYDSIHHPEAPPAVTRVASAP